jgi:hypothetical protein
MRKVSLGLATMLLAGTLTVPVFGTETLLRKAEAPDKSFEAFLPPANFSVPWLNIDTRTKLPKGDYPVGRNAEVAPLIIKAPHIQHADMAEFALGGGWYATG